MELKIEEGGGEEEEGEEEEEEEEEEKEEEEEEEETVFGYSQVCSGHRSLTCGHRGQIRTRGSPCCVQRQRDGRILILGHCISGDGGWQVGVRETTGIAAVSAAVVSPWSWSVVVRVVKRAFCRKACSR